MSGKGKSPLNAWQEEFVSKIDGLRQRASRFFERFADEILVPVHKEFAEFTTKHDFRVMTPQAQRGLRSYKFALTEDAYLLAAFHAKGVAEVEFEYECFVPGQGDVGKFRVSSALGAADRDWVESCLQTALDFFVAQYGSAKPERVVAEALAV